MAEDGRPVSYDYTPSSPGDDDQRCLRRRRLTSDHFICMSPVNLHNNRVPQPQRASYGGMSSCARDTDRTASPGFPKSRLLAQRRVSSLPLSTTPKSGNTADLFNGAGAPAIMSPETANNTKTSHTRLIDRASYRRTFSSSNSNSLLPQTTLESSSPPTRRPRSQTQVIVDRLLWPNTTVANRRSSAFPPTPESRTARHRVWSPATPPKAPKKRRRATCTCLGSSTSVSEISDPVCCVTPEGSPELIRLENDAVSVSAAISSTKMGVPVAPSSVFTAGVRQQQQLVRKGTLSEAFVASTRASSGDTRRPLVHSLPAKVTAKRPGQVTLPPAFEQDEAAVIKRRSPSHKLQEFRALSYCCHRGPRESLMSQEVGSLNLKGLVNLVVLILCVQNAQLIVDNILRYGILVSWFPNPSIILNHWIFIASLLCMHVIALLSLWLERRHGYLFLRWLSEARDSEDKRNAQLIRRLSRRLSAMNIELADTSAATTVKTDDLSKGEEDRATTMDVKLLESIVSSAYQKSSFHLSIQHILLQILIWSQIGCSTGLMLLLPYLAVRFLNSDYLTNTALLLFSVSWFLKLISFHHVMSDLREVFLTRATLQDVCYSAEDLQCCQSYPQYPTSYQMLEYLWMPTLCFQFSYPRTDRIDWMSILRHAMLGAVCAIFMKVIVEQYMAIIVHKTFTISMVEQTSLVRLFAHFFERTLKLSIPSLYTWLLTFVATFHHWLIILAELTRFADRHFYLDWWNASGIADYWRRWNLPVHYFCTRHIYKPLLKRGFSPFMASQVIFVLSALAHEYLVCAPLRMGWTGLVFTAFIAQTPASLFVDLYIAKKSSTFGNLIFWVAFCFTGQPIAILVYYYLWGVREGTIQTLSSSISSSDIAS